MTSDSRMVLHYITALFLFIQSLLPSPMAPSSGVVQAGSMWVTATGAVDRVIDGDTIAVRLGDGKTVRVRYIGMNTPEIWPELECGGASSTARNRELVDGKIVTLVPGPGLYDKFGRRLAYVYVGDTFVNQTLVAEGWASLMMIPPNTEYHSEFERLEKIARSSSEGIWSCPS